MRDAESKKKYDMEYEKTHIKRVPLHFQCADYDRVKAAADAAGETVSGYIKTAIKHRLDEGF